MADYPYPDEPTTVKSYEADVEALYVKYGQVFPDSPDAFRWFTRYGYSCRHMPEPIARAKHLGECEEELAHTPKPPLPPTQPGTPTNRPLLGPLRIEDKMYRDDSGWRRVFGCSYFPALHIAKYDTGEFDRQMDVVAAANHQVVRIFASVGGWTGWLGREVAPLPYTSWVWSGNFMRTDTYGPPVAAWPDYDDVLTYTLRALRARQLRAHITFGDMQITCPDARAEQDLHTRISRIVQREGGWQVCALAEMTNEIPFNRYGSDSDQSIAQMGQLIDIWRRECPGVLTAQGALPGNEEPEGLGRASRYGDICVSHTSRTPIEFTMKRTFGLVYGWPVYRGFPKAFWQGEPWGPGKGVTPYPMTSNDEVTALYALHALSGQASNFFEGPSVLANEPLESVWGLRELPALFAQHLPEDVAQWEHGHDANAQGMEYWWKGNSFRSSASPDWNPAPPRAIDTWTLYPSGRTGTGTPPKGVTGLLVGTFVP